MTGIDESIAAAPIHEFQLVHRIRPPGGGLGWSQTQTAWSNAADTKAALDDLVRLHGLDPAELVGAAADRAAAAPAPAASPSSAPGAGSDPGAGTAPAGM
jgi:hypothetical protein